MITCLIAVMISVPPALIQNYVTISGKIIGSNEYSYIGDFSKEATKNKYYGDYSKVMVSKENCVETL
jgi:hypothetical protein